MMARLVPVFARMPDRQLRLILGGVLAVAVALLWALGMRAPLGTLRLQNQELSRLGAAVRDPALQRQEQAALEQEIGALGAALKLAPANTRADQLQVALIGALDRAAAHHGVRVASASPGPARTVARFRELPFDLDASGGYQGLVEWLAEIERSQPAVALLHFDLRPAGADGQLAMKLRIAAYLPTERAQ